MDQLYAFSSNNPVVVNPRTGNPGMLELHSITESGNGVFIFAGSLNKEECEQAINTGAFLMGTNAHTVAQMVWPGNESTFTVYSKGGANGYVRLCELQ